MAKGSYARIILATGDLDGAFARGCRPAAPTSSRSRPSSRTGCDCAFRDPAVNLIRINELR
jgi:hypothetical protein